MDGEKWGKYIAGGRNGDKGSENRKTLSEKMIFK